MENKNVCSGGDTLVFACSGAADVGAVADQAARKMTQEGYGQMFCLAGIG
ncbi:MAG: putative zinc-binding protein, partial [Planctomycetota bacterium]